MTTRDHRFNAANAVLPIILARIVRSSGASMKEIQEQAVIEAFKMADMMISRETANSD